MSVEKMKFPREACTFLQEPGVATLAASGADDSPRRFSMVLLSGKPILNHWWWGNLAIDLNGCTPDKKRMPALREHARDRIVGHIDSHSAGADLVVEGVFSTTTADGKEVLDLMDEGFPWQASAYVPPLKIERIPEGESVVVNGHTVKGPGTVFRKSIYREASFCALGADSHTKVSALSEASELEAEVVGNSLTSPKGKKLKSPWGNYEAQHPYEWAVAKKMDESGCPVTKAMQLVEKERPGLRENWLKEQANKSALTELQKKVSSGGAYAAFKGRGASARTKTASHARSSLHPWEAAVEQKVLEGGLTRTAAMQAVEKDRPGLREQWLVERGRCPV